jgi:L-amino acid ligase C-terminal domain 2
VDFIGCAIRVALGEHLLPMELEPKMLVPVIQRYVFPNPGRVIDVRGAHAARQVAGIADVIVTARPGDIIPPAGDKRPSGAMVLATGRTKEEALAAAKAGLAEIEIETR